MNMIGCSLSIIAYVYWNLKFGFKFEFNLSSMVSKYEFAFVYREKICVPVIKASFVSK